MSDYNQSFNMFKSLSSVHLPPPPSSVKAHTQPQASCATQNTPSSEFSFDADGLLDNNHEYTTSQNLRVSASNNNARRLSSVETSPFLAPHAFHKQQQQRPSPQHTFQHKNSNVLTDISNPILNTPPPTQSRRASSSAATAAAFAVHKMNNTPTLNNRRVDSLDKENVYSHMLSPVGSSPINEHKEKKPSPPKFQHSQQPAQSAPTSSVPAPTARGDKRKFMAELPDPKDLPPIHDDGQKPPYSYATLIGMSILRSPQRKLTLSQIYQWINDTFGWYRNCKSGWQNSIRHNLSLNKAFKKQERPKGDPGKGNYWVVEPGYEYQFLDTKVSSRRTSITSANHPVFSSQDTGTPMSSTESVSMSRSSTTDEETDAQEDEQVPRPPFDGQFQYLENEPLKRCNSAIGLQRAVPKRAFEEEQEVGGEVQEPKRKKKRVNSLGRNLDAGEIPVLQPTTNVTEPTTTNNNTAKNELESPKKFISGSLILGPNKPDLYPQMFQQAPGMMTSPNTSIRNHRANIRNMTTGASSPPPPPLDYDVFTSNEPSPLRGQVKASQDDDAVSRLIFGSPNKREQQRRQYYEQTQFLQADESAADVFGVDLYQLCQREIARGPSFTGEEDEDEAEQHFQQQEFMNNITSPVRSSHVDYSVLKFFDSPIKNQQQNMSPPKLARKNTL